MENSEYSRVYHWRCITKETLPLPLQKYLCFCQVPLLFFSFVPLPLHGPCSIFIFLLQVTFNGLIFFFKGMLNRLSQNFGTWYFISVGGSHARTMSLLLSHVLSLGTPHQSSIGSGASTVYPPYTVSPAFLLQFSTHSRASVSYPPHTVPLKILLQSVNVYERGP